MSRAVVPKYIGYDEEPASNCIGCYYRRVMTGMDSHTACHYSIYEDKVRPCTPQNCTVKLVLGEGETYSKDKVRVNRILSESVGLEPEPPSDPFETYYKRRSPYERF